MSYSSRNIEAQTNEQKTHENTCKDRTQVSRLTGRQRGKQAHR